MRQLLTLVKGPVVQPKLRVLPTRVRPMRYETVESFAARVRDANRLSKGAWLQWLKPYAVELGHDPRRTSADLLEQVAGIARGHFGRIACLLPSHEDGTTCVQCATGLNERYGCTRCSGGTEVIEEAHDGPRVCPRHSRWVGPGTTPDAQFQVGASTITADRTYRRLRAEGVIDAHRLAEILGGIDLWVEAGALAFDAAQRFEVAVRLAASVLRPGRIGRIAAVERDPATRYAELDAVVSTVVHQSATVLIDGMWHLLRTAAYAELGRPHAFKVAPAGGPRDERAYLDQARTCIVPREKHLHLTQFVSSERPGTRFEAFKSLKLKSDFACPLGHAFDSSTFMLRNSKASGGCGYCAGKRILAGFNSLADTHPDDAAEWHPSLNGDLRPDQVGAGSEDEVAWLCAAEQHVTWQRIRLRTRKGAGCTVCSNRSVAADVNSLAAVRPDLAADWHDELNAPLRPDEVLFKTERPIWWICREDGHDPYEMSALQRTKGGRCRVCNRVVAHETTSLAATHPHLLKRWDKKENGKLKPENVLSGSGLTAWWRCERGHSFPAVIQNMTRKFVCGDCSGRYATEANCLRVTHPHLVAEFDFSRNGRLTPDNLTAGSGERVSRICELGHNWPAPVRERARGSRCRYCSNRAVWVGFNDMATTRPDMVADWDDANGDLRPTDVVAGTNKKIWWKCEVHGPWPASGQQKSRGGGCQECLAERIERAREAVRAADGALSPSALLARLERTSRQR